MSWLLYPDSGISMDEEIVLGDMIWSYNKAELWEIQIFLYLYFHSTQYSSKYKCNTKKAASLGKLYIYIQSVAAPSHDVSLPSAWYRCAEADLGHAVLIPDLFRWGQATA